ncbi:carbon starvation CstA family protein [Mycolicibacterium hassiacum DSM 44199]|jgi:carbon starvation protein|uniref:Carbon starvation CstA family protein n=1 Tax=Mycolicibacterium hassiacum (strain DSM 44199 / CIP 105218 / JCM 12690 / 3849) TaxID=1122247 RepID=K5B9C6_MYCHD|nr:carbon starvation CstA family protein [Mycolicibacterium hassiacum]EKF25213.1 carbon starvation CstA family protein [Mycolicibacterium hassiacum DSM 44199]MBX5487606.1 carbon starvation protein A [Mycolicibacterium hassiacum]MDA4087186.1 carbon starvation protein CstA [Mycolicibacterium hassiacum DSM 44199]PZN24191.1 MAG: carbon starvation protein A [Mycolicibacterium hassiacum]VCT89167.1 Carbon starvation protein A [Mycolicibacterium hassiacum DSM 44199]
MATPTAAAERIEETRGDVTYIRTDKNLPPVAIIDRSPITVRHRIIFGIIAVLGAIAWAIIAFFRGETVNAVWFVIAAICTYIVGFRFYARLIELKIVKPRDDHATPAELFENGTDYLPTDRRVLFGHHFAAIAGAGPLVGPVLAMQMGYLPGTIWIIIGAVLAGCVQDFLVLSISTRRRGRSLGQMARDELGPIGGAAAIIGVLVIMVILLAVLALVVVQALAQSPWGVFSIAMTIPIALFMGVYLRYLRPGRVTEVSLIGVALLLLAVAGGRWVAETGWGASLFNLSPVTLSWCLIIYGFAASVLPVWLLLAPRDYLSTFMKVGTIALLAVGILLARPLMQAPAISEFATRGDGPVFAGSLFPFLFITIACGALSGFHSLISSGTTPKLLQKESQMRLIGYGGMLTESFVAIMALITAAILNQHLYFTLNAPASVTGGTAETAAEYVNSLPLSGAPITAEQITQAAESVGEESIVSRTGGAPTLAFGMSEVLAKVFGGDALKAFWYHFAIMFEALFILTTVDAGTRVARFMLSDGLSNLGGPLRRLKDPSWRVGAWVCSVIVVAAWGSILLMGVTDPLGGINTLFPLFGIANQLLAAIALTVVTAVVVKKGYLKWAWIPAVPLLWDLIVTLTASWQKIFSGDPKVGYWTQHGICRAAQEADRLCLTAKTADDVDKIVRNTFIQGSLSIVFAVLVVIVFVTGFVMVIRVLRGERPPTTEDEPVPSRIFGPSGLIATKHEKEVQKQWDALRESATPSATSAGTSPA